MGHGSFRPPLEREEGERGGVRRRKGEGRDAKKGGGAVCWGFLIAGMDGGGCTIIGHAGTTHLAKAATAAVQCSAVRCVVWAGGSVGWAGGESVCVCVFAWGRGVKGRGGRSIDRIWLTHGQARQGSKQGAAAKQARSSTYPAAAGRSEEKGEEANATVAACLPVAPTPLLWYDQGGAKIARW